MACARRKHPKLAVCAELEDEPRHQGGAECGGHRVRVGHVREVDVGRAPQRALRALDAQKVEENPAKQALRRLAQE